MATETPREIRYDGIHCNLAIQQFGSKVVVLRISGTDIGEFGDAPMQGMNECLAGAEPVEFYIDAREVRGASIEVSGEWARWLGAHRVQFSGIRMLTGSRFVEVTADFVRRFADLQGIMRIYTEPAAFDAALEESIREGRDSRPSS
jgi:hypothetical protein